VRSDFRKGEDSSVVAVDGRQDSRRPSEGFFRT